MVQFFQAGRGFDTDYKVIFNQSKRTLTIKAFEKGSQVCYATYKTYPLSKTEFEQYSNLTYFDLKALLKSNNYYAL